MLDRRTLLLRSTAAAGVLALGPRLGTSAQGTPEAAEPAELAITLTDEDYVLPDPLPAGRYQVTVANESSAGTHVSLGRIPEAISDEQVANWFDDDFTNDGDTPTFFSIQFVGLPDWPEPGTSRTGVVDVVEPGRYLVIDPISAHKPRVIQVTGTYEQTADPTSDTTITLKEMELDFPTLQFQTGPHRWKIVNEGGFTHEMAILPVGDGLTNDELGEYVAWAMSIPEDATPDPATPVPGGGKIDLGTYNPVAAMSLLRPGGTAWIDLDLPTGTYAALCMVPGPTDEIPPHAMMGMHAVFVVD